MIFISINIERIKEVLHLEIYQKAKRIFETSQYLKNFALIILRKE